MKKVFTLLFKIVPLLVLTLVSIKANAQTATPTFQTSLQNVVQTTDRTLEFDLYLLNTDPVLPMELASYQAGITLNPAIYTGGTLTASLVPGTSTLSNPTQVPTNITFKASSTIKLAAKAPPGAGLGSIISKVSPGTRIVRVQITSTVPFAANTTPNFAFIPSTAVSPSYPTAVALYVGGINTQMPVTMGVNAFVPENPVLIVPVSPVAYAVTGTGSYCQGGVGLPVGLANSEVGVTYTLFKNAVAQVPTVPGTGAAISFGNQLFGTYTVTGTRINLTTAMTGNAVITESLVPTAPTASLTQPTCALVAGTISVTSTVTGLSFSIDGTTYTNTTGVFAGLASGTYSLTAMNAAGCVSQPTSVTINAAPLTPAAPTATLIQPTCALATGTISVTSTVTGLSFSIDGINYTNTTGVFAGLASGTYSLTAMNTAGCVSQATSVIINALPVLTVPTASVTVQPGCIVATGTIVVSAPAMGTGFTYSIDGGLTWTTTATFAGLSPGSYTVTVKETVTGCVSPATPLTVNPIPAPPVPTIAGPLDPLTLLPATLSSGITTGQVYTTEPGMTNYVWAVSAAGTITAPANPAISNSITVTWTNPTGQQFVSVNYTAPGACTAAAPTVMIINYYPFATSIDPLTIPQFIDPVPHFAAGLRVNAKAGGSLTIKEVLVQQVALSTGTVLSTGTIGTTPGAGVGKYAAYAISKDGGATFGPAMWPAQTIEAQVGNPLTVQYQNKLIGVRYSDFNILADQTLMMNGYPVTGNRLTDPYTGDIPMVVHLHGGEIPSGSDGGPTSWFMPDYSLLGPGFAFGSSSLMSYPNQQEAGTLWYHPHDQGLTRINVYTGLAGYYFLRGPAEEAAHLPGWSGDDKVMEVTPTDIPRTPTFNGANTYLPEIELAIQDRMFNTKGELYWPVAPTNPEIHPFWTPEFVGDVMTVNGKSWPYLSVAPRKYRFRLLEGCNARFLNLWLQNLATGVNGPAITVVGSDGALMDAPATLAPGQTLLMAPGERYDVVIDFTAFAGQVLTLMNNAAAPYPTGTPVTPGTTDRIMQFVVNGTMVSATGGTAADKSAVPANLRVSNPMVKLTDFAGNLTAGVTPAVKRQIILNEITGAGGPVQVLFNNSHFDTSTPLPGAPPDFGGPTELPVEGTTELFTIINTSADAHPIHIHLTQWQLVSRQPFNVAGYLAAYGAAWAGNGKGYPEWPVGQGYPGGAGSPLPYSTLNADGAVGGNPAVTPFLTGTPVPATPEERLWKDDVKAYPGEVATFIVRYAPTDKPIASPATDLKYPFDPTVGPGYVWHCHIIDHEDMDMMRPLMIQPTTAVLPPQITAQPVPATVCDGAVVSFSVTATSARAISYQWQVSTNAGATFTNVTNIAPYSGALSRSLSINPATLAMNANQYRVVLTSTDGVTTSNAALLTIDQTVAIAPTANVVQPTCALATGTISVTSTTTGLSFSIDGVSYTNTTGLFTGVIPGTYNLTAKNALGCVSPPTNVVINAVPSTPAAPTASLVQPTCALATGTVSVTSTITGLSFSMDGISYVNTTGIFTGVVAGTYSLTAQNAAGCVSLPTSVTINAAPSAPAAPTASLVQPTCALATGTVSVTSTVTGLSFSIDGISYANNTGLFTGVVAGTYSLTAKNAAGCVSLPTNVVINAAPAAISLGGTVKYHNIANTPMNNVAVKLVQAGNIVQQTVTGIAGDYLFANVCPGTYDVVLTTLKDVGGVNSTDAGQANAWNVTQTAGVHPAIERVRFLGGDVNGNNSIVSNDAAMIQEYFLTLGTAPVFDKPWEFWKAGDMVTTQPQISSVMSVTISAGSSTVTQNFLGMVSGDFNQSFVPSSLKSALASSKTLTLHKGEIVSVLPLTTIDLPIKAELAMQVGAISLILNYPEDKLQIEGVFLKDKIDQPVRFNTINGELRIGWNSLSPLSVINGETMLTVRVKTTADLIEKDVYGFELAANPLNELADGQFNVIPDATLKVNELQLLKNATAAENIPDRSEEMLLTSSPNPFKEKAFIKYSLPENGHVTLEISSITGSRMTVLSNEQQSAGEYSMNFDGGSLSPGVYLITLKLENQFGIKVKTIRIIKQ